MLHYIENTTFYQSLLLGFKQTNKQLHVVTTGIWLVWGDIQKL